MRVDETFTCVECGGTVHLLTRWPADDPPRPGDLATYRCADCNDRFDVVLDEDADEEDGESASGGPAGVDSETGFRDPRR